MSNNVIVAVNGGAGSDAALAWAVAWTNRTKQDLVVCTVIDTDLFEADALAPTREQVLGRAKKDIERYSPRAEPEYRVERGRPSAVLAELSSSAAMIVIGAHKTDPVTGLLHGTLPLRVVDRAECPVVVVPSGWHAHGDKVVVGVDFETDDKAVEFAVAASKLLEQSLEVVHSWQVPTAVAGSYFTWFDYSEELNDANWNALHKVTEPISTENPGLAVSQLVAEGRPTDVIAAQSESASLVVVGTHHRKAVAGMVLGSVAHDLLINVNRPIAVVSTPTRRKLHVLTAVASSSSDTES